MSTEEWDDQVKMMMEKSKIAKSLSASKSIFEAGCGRGAFLDSIHRLYGCKDVMGCNQSSSCIDIASRRLTFGKFWVGDASDLNLVPNDSKEVAFMYGVTLYLNDLEQLTSSPIPPCTIDERGVVRIYSIIVAEERVALSSLRSSALPRVPP